MADRKIPPNSEKIIAIANNGFMRLFMRSVLGSDKPIPLHEPHTKPCRSFPFSSFAFMHAKQDSPFLPVAQVPVLLQCEHGYKLAFI